MKSRRPYCDKTEAGRSLSIPLFWKLLHSANCLEFIKTGKQAESRISNFIQQKFCEKQFGHVGMLKIIITLFLNQIFQSSDCVLLESVSQPCLEIWARAPYGSAARLTPSHREITFRKPRILPWFH